VDADSDGLIGYSEFLTRFKALPSQAVSADGNHDKMSDVDICKTLIQAYGTASDAFVDMDLDHDGRLGKDELSEGLGRIGISLSSARLETFLESIDVDSNRWVLLHAEHRRLLKWWKCAHSLTRSVIISLVWHLLCRLIDYKEFLRGLSAVSVADQGGKQDEMSREESRIRDKLRESFAGETKSSNSLAVADMSPACARVCIRVCHMLCLHNLHQSDG